MLNAMGENGVGTLI